jgi:nucleoporin-like protein 2
MSRRQEVCRDFQRGNCRFGTRCKFSHQLPQNQQPQSNAFDSGRRHSPQQQGGFGERGRNSFEALSNANSSQKPQQQVPLKDHKCNDPRVCKEQIKDDMAHEHPLFWRLTSYGHWKFLPNDISGDVSPEELRALAYDSAKQGLSLHQIVSLHTHMVNYCSFLEECFGKTVVLVC